MSDSNKNSMANRLQEGGSGEERPDEVHHRAEPRTSPTRKKWPEPTPKLLRQCINDQRAAAKEAGVPGAATLQDLRESKNLDFFAWVHARFMADAGEVFSVFGKETKLTEMLTCRNTGANVCRGSSVQAMCLAQANSKEFLDNSLSDYFTEVGIGIVRGKDGFWYMCQIFRCDK